MFRFARLVLACSIGALLTGCPSDNGEGNAGGGAGGNSGGGGSGGQNPIAMEQLTSEFAAIFCQRMRACCGPDDGQELGPELMAVIASDGCPSSPDILEHVDDQFNFARLKESVAGNRATFDGQAARTCFEFLRGLSCGNWGALLDGQQAALTTACRNMVRGTLADGQPCPGANLVHECASATCSGENPDLCAPALPEGAPCDDRCEDVFDCDQQCAGELECGADRVCAVNPPARASPICDGKSG